MHGQPAGGNNVGYSMLGDWHEDSNGLCIMPVCWQHAD
jgi:hypothetical protein